MKTRLIITAAISFFLTAAWFFFFLRPALVEKSTLGLSIDDTSRRLDDIRRTVLETPEFYQKYKEMLSQKKTAESQLYSREDLVRLFADLEDKAVSHKLIIIEITPSIEELLLLNSKPPGDMEPQVLHLSINIKGRFIDSGEFIGEMEKENFYQGMDFCHIANTGQGSPISEIQFVFKTVLGTLRDSL